MSRVLDIVRALSACAPSSTCSRVGRTSARTWRPATLASKVRFFAISVGRLVRGIETPKLKSTTHGLVVSQITCRLIHITM